MIRRSIVLIALLMAVTYVMAIGSFVSDDNLSEAQLRKYNSIYLESVCQREAGNVVAQYRLLERALEVNPNGADALYDMAVLAINNGLNLPVPDMLAKAHELASENDTYTFTYAGISLVDTKYESEGLKLMAPLLDKPVMREKAYSCLCDYYERKNDYDALVALLEKWRPIKDDDVSISTRKLQAAVATDHKEEALLIADTLIATSAVGVVDYRALKGEVLLELNRADEAYAIYKDIVAENPKSASAQRLLYRYASQTNNKQLQIEAARSMVLNPEIEMSDRITAYKAWYDDIPKSERVAARDSLLAQLFLLEDDDPMLIRGIAYQMEQEKVADSVFIPIYNKLLEIDPTDENSRLNLMQNSIQKSDYKEVMRLCTDGLKLNPKQFLYYLFGGEALAIEKKYEASYEMFSNGFKYITENTHTELVSTYYSAYADVLYKLDRKQEAYLMYDSALVYNNENIVCLNNYAYYLSLERVQLDKAAKMSARTIELKPEEPTYLDTYAWILFEKEEYEEARKYIDQTITYVEDPDSADNVSIFEHAGDIYYMLGIKDKALQYWRQASKLDPSSEIIKKKIKNRKFLRE